MRELIPPLSSIPWPLLIAGPLFLSCFVLLVLLVYRPAAKQAYLDAGRLPLD